MLFGDKYFAYHEKMKAYENQRQFFGDLSFGFGPSYNWPKINTMIPDVEQKFKDEKFFKFDILPRNFGQSKFDMTPLEIRIQGKPPREQKYAGWSESDIKIILEQKDKPLNPKQELAQVQKPLQPIVEQAKEELKEEAKENI